MTSVAVRLLGPVSVDGSSGDLPLGPGRQRSVLAVLLLGLGRPVPANDLIDRVWGEESPPAAEQALRSYLCRLRKVLEPSATVRLERRDGGYAAVVAEDELDLTVFRRRAHRARVAVRDARHGDALADFADALSRADGPLLAGVGSPWLDEQRRLLERERHAVALERNDLALAVGRPDLVVVDALARMTGEPYDERLAGQAVLALAGVGRTAEALDVYEQIRRRLAEELGIDPGSALRDVHQRVLSGVDTTAVTPAPRISAAPQLVQPAAPALVPRQLPPMTRGFVDRHTELQALDRMLLTEEDAAITVICGPGGAGKTTLAVHWARVHADVFPDGQLFVDLHGFDADCRRTSPEVALRGLLTALGLDQAAVPDDLADMVGVYRTLLAERRVLLVADDVGTADQARLLLPPGRGSAMVVTSRSSLSGLAATLGAQVLPLGGFDDAAAHQLLTGRLGAARTLAEPAALERLVTHCGGLPLALALVAGRAAAEPSLSLATLAEDLEDETRRIAALHGGDGRSDLEAVVAGSVATLSTAATSVLAWLAAGPRVSIRGPLVAALADLSGPDAEAAVRELLTVHLLEPAGPRRYRLHDLVRLAVRSWPAPGLEEAVDRLLVFLVEESAHQDIDDLLSAAAYAKQTRRDCALCDLAGALERPLGSAGRWSDLVRVNECAVAAAERLGDDRRRAVARIGLGRGRIGLREFGAAEADLTEALSLAEGVDDLGLRARAHRAVARLGAHQHRFDLALHHDACGLELHRRRGDVLGQAHARNAIGWHLAHLDRPAEGLASCDHALRIFVEHGDAAGQALTQDSIGYALERLGRAAESRDAYRRAVDLWRRLGVQVELANTLLRLAGVTAALGDAQEAALVRGEAEEILRLSGRHVLEP